MASKFLFSTLILALAFNFSTLLAVRIEAGIVPPVIHIVNTVANSQLPNINVTIKVGGTLKGSAELSPKKEYQLKVDAVNDVYQATAVFGLQSTSFNAYQPEPVDVGVGDIYWKADELGFSVSYDKNTYKLVAPW